MKTLHSKLVPEGEGSVRLNKFLSMAGIASRRKADALIEEGKVRVNGKTVMGLGTKINPMHDKIFVNEKQVVVLDSPVYIVLNKPSDTITTSSDERGRMTVMQYVKTRERVFPIGRLDRKTTGVLLFTNDGEFANRLMHPKFEVEKAYKVTLDKPLTPADAEKISKGIRLSDGKTKPAEVHPLPESKGKAVGIVIHEGRNRQIHRMFEAIEYRVDKLDRVAYAGIEYTKLKRGEWRYLTKSEIRKLKTAAGIADE